MVYYISEGTDKKILCAHTCFDYYKSYCC